MKRRPAATSYAKALFAVAKERDQMELVGRELGDAAATFGSVVDLRDFFARPWIPATAKREVAMKVAQRSGLSKLSSDFLALVAERGRTDHLAVIADKYQKLLNQELHRLCAHVRTAVPLTDEARDTLSAKLEMVFGGRHVLLEEIVDRTMLGGLIVESDGVVLNASLEGQLETMRRYLGAGERS